MTSGCLIIGLIVFISGCFSPKPEPAGETNRTITLETADKVTGGVNTTDAAITTDSAMAAAVSETNMHILHPGFNFTTADFAAGLVGLPTFAATRAIAGADGAATWTQEAIVAAGDFLDLAERMLQIPEEFLILVDKSHPLPADFVPLEPTALSTFPELRVSRDSLSLDSRIIGPLLELSRAAKTEGYSLTVSSAYRSYAYQEGVFKRNVAAYGESKARRFSAPPGCSQHQLGSTVDFGSITNDFARTAAGIWMRKNAGNFGWSLSYPRGMEEETGYMWESWHWRWLGKAAVEMQEKYFDGVQQRMLEFWNENATKIREAHIGGNPENETK